MPGEHGESTEIVDERNAVAPTENTTVTFPGLLYEQFQNDIDRFVRYKLIADVGSTQVAPTSDADTFKPFEKNDTLNAGE